MSKQGDPSLDGSNTLIYGILLVGAVIFIAWWKFHTPLNALLGKVRLGEIFVLSFFTSQFDAIAQWIRETPASDVTFKQAVFIGNSTGSYYRWLLPPMAVGFWFALKRINRLEANKRSYSVRELIRSQLHVWPQNTCIANLDLHGTDPRKGPWASALTEIEFVRAHKLLNAASELDRDRCAQVFIQQLGKPWRGWEVLPSHAKAIFAILVARIASQDDMDDKRKNIADEYVRKLSREMPTGKADLSWVEPLIRESIKSKRVKTVLERHAYELTMIAGLLEAARKPGVLASCDFRWVKPVDRRLFYTLNMVGRRVSFAEIAGVYSHWLAERSKERALYSPYVIKAVDGLEEAMKNYVYEENEA